MLDMVFYIGVRQSHHNDLTDPTCRSHWPKFHVECHAQGEETRLLLFWNHADEPSPWTSTACSRRSCDDQEAVGKFFAWDHEDQQGSTWMIVLD